MKTREAFDAAWDSMLAGMYPQDRRRIRQLIQKERAFVDRAAQARAIRWAAQYRATTTSFGTLASQVERGEVTIPEEP